jgi:hypothetical protein
MMSDGLLVYAINLHEIQKYTSIATDVSVQVLQRITQVAQKTPTLTNLHHCHCLTASPQKNRRNEENYQPLKLQQICIKVCYKIF